MNPEAAANPVQPGSASAPQLFRLSALQGADCVQLTALLLLAVAMRIAFYTGFFGSDEVTYVESAITAANGVGLKATYIGSIRLGINYPIALALRLFGQNEAAAALWGLVCSVLEVGAVYWFARRAFSRQVAVVSALTIALLPLHVHLAGRIMGDPPLGLFMTLTFVFFFEAECSNRRKLYFLAGLCAGFVFWIKESTVIFVLVFVFWFIYRRRFNPRWSWSILAMTLVVGANFAAMWLLSGNPFYLVDSIRTSFHTTGNPAAGSIAALRLENATPWFYFKFLFKDIWHTWFIGFLAAGGVILAIRRLRRDQGKYFSLAFLLVWCIGLLAVFSLFVASVFPLRLIPKQTNYMTIFFAPLSLLAGIAIVELRPPFLRGLVLSAYVFGAVFLSALEQQVIHTFTANSAAALRAAGKIPTTSVYVGQNAEMLNDWLSMLPRAGMDHHVANVESLSKLFAGPSPVRSHGDNETVVALAIVDEQTLGWGSNGLGRSDAVPDCWQRIEKLDPVFVNSLGRHLASSALFLVEAAPGQIAKRISDKLNEVLTPRPAVVYRIPVNCSW